MKIMHLNQLSAVVAASLLASSPVLAEPVLDIHGLIEVEASAGADETDTSSSDIALATVELTFEAEINKRIHAHIIALHEDDDTEEFVIDEGVININLAEGLQLNAGRMYVPFGNFSSYMISDPLTLEIGETRESAVQLVMDEEGLYASVYVFNGDADEAGLENDKVDDFGFNIGYTAEGLDIGACYISNFADTDGMTALLDANAAIPVQEQDPGLAAHIVYTTGPVTLIAEYVAAQDELDDGSKPSASNIELAYEFDAGIIAIGHQTTDELAGVLPESRHMFGYTMSVLESATLKFEYMIANDYSAADGGTDESGGMFTTQLAVEF